MNKIASDLIARFKSRESVIGIVGLGYVGLPLALRYSQVGYRVLGLDIDPLRRLKNSIAARPISSTSHLRRIQTHGGGGLCTPTTDFTRVRRVRRADHLRAHARWTSTANRT